MSLKISDPSAEAAEPADRADAGDDVELSASVRL